MKGIKERKIKERFCSSENKLDLLEESFSSSNRSYRCATKISPLLVRLAPLGYKSKMLQAWSDAIADIIEAILFSIV